MFNNTVDKLLYAQNCSTGVNDVAASSDFGALFNTIRGNIEKTGQGQISIRAGFYSVVTTAIISSGTTTTCPLISTHQTCLMGLVVAGAGKGFAGFGSVGYPAQLNGTMLVAKTNGMTMMEATSQSGSVTCSSSGCTGGAGLRGVTITRLSFLANNLAAIGLNMAMAETGGAGNIIENDVFGQYSGTGFTTALIMDGNEDSWVATCIFDGAGGLTPGGATLDLQWQTPVGNVNVQRSDFGGLTHMAVWSQQVSIEQSTINSVKILGPGAGSTLGEVIDIDSSYLANQIDTGLIQLNGQTVNVIKFSGDTITVTSTVPLFAGTGQVYNVEYASNNWAFTAACNWNSGGATLTHQATDTANNVRVNSGPGANGVCTNFPFSIAGNNANGNF